MEEISKIEQPNVRRNSCKSSQFAGMSISHFRRAGSQQEFALNPTRPPSCPAHEMPEKGARRRASLGVHRNHGRILQISCVSIDTLYHVYYSN